jgi:DNA-directed RNA polymerase subunit RPC12/RpoP
MLIKCAECGKEISSNAAVCPNCGNPVKTEDELVKEGLKGGFKLLLIGVGIFLLLAAIFIWLSSQNII